MTAHRTTDPPSDATPPRRFPPAVVAGVVQQHAEEAALLHHVRGVLVRAPHVGLLHLERIDERIAAHFDGLAVAGEHGSRRCLAALERPGRGEVFALAVRAIESRDAGLLDHALSLVAVLPDAARGVASALGWVSAGQLQGIVRPLLASPEPARRALGFDACRMHQVDPGIALRDGLTAPQPAVRAAALRCAGELGRVDLLAPARQAQGDEHPDVAVQAALAAGLLGDRGAALEALAEAARQPTPQGDRALALALAASGDAAAGALARDFSRRARERPDDPVHRRRLIRALGLLGDPRFVPWLIARMAEPAISRLCAEAFCWITGADLARLDLEAAQAPAPASPVRPSDDPGDDDVALDDDESLPWPDVARVRDWWDAQASMHAAAAAGRRLFEGEARGMAAAQRVLREGMQRRRARAALLACALRPGLVLFPVAGRARRQRRALGLPAQGG